MEDKTFSKTYGMRPRAWVETTVRLPSDLRRRCDERAEQDSMKDLKVTRSDVIRQAIIYYLRSGLDPTRKTKKKGRKK